MRIMKLILISCRYYWVCFSRGIPKFILSVLVFCCAVMASVSVRANSTLLRHYGDVMQMGLPFIALCTAYAQDRHQDSGLDNSEQFLHRYAFVNGVVNTAKFTFREARPAPHQHNYTSFPSGHTASAFSGAAYLAATHTSWWVRVSALGAASLVAYSRVESRYHHPQDVFAGAALASAVMFLPKSDSTQYFVTPSQGGGVAVGLSITLGEPAAKKVANYISL